MKDRVPAVIFYAKGATTWQRVVKETLSSTLAWFPGKMAESWRASAWGKSFLEDEFTVLSFLLDWKEAFADSPSLKVEWCDVNDLIEYRKGLRRLREVPLSIVLHSAAWDDLVRLRRGQGYFQSRRGTLLLFLGNEYDRMRGKIGFAKAVAADYIASQLPMPAAEWLYGECVHSKVLPGAPALNPTLYFPRTVTRTIDLGFRGDLYLSHLLGDTERTDVMAQLSHRARDHGLIADIEYGRCHREQWSAFLSACKGVIGAESGTYYLERGDETQLAVKAYVAEHPRADFAEMHERFFKYYPNPVSGKAISSRHFEPVGTKTCQVLLEGQYNGILKANEHYISVKKDYSNLDEALCLFKDEEFRRAMVDRTYEYVMGGHTYRHRAQELLRAIGV